MNIRPAIKEMSVFDLTILKYKVRNSTDKSDQEFSKEIEEELKLRNLSYNK
jgi:hypothetical protein